MACQVCYLGEGGKGCHCAVKTGSSPWAGTSWWKGVRAGPDIQGPSQCPSQERASQGSPGQPEPWALGTGLACGPVGVPSSLGPIVKQGRAAVRCWRLVLLWCHWGWWPWGNETGSWVVGRVGEPWGGWAGAGGADSALRALKVQKRGWR